MELGIGHVLFLLAGVLVGAYAAWFAGQTRRETAFNTGKAEGDVERTALTEQLRAANDKVSERDKRVQELDAAMRTMADSLAKAEIEAAKYLERAGQLDQLKEVHQATLESSANLQKELAAAREAVGALSKSEEEKERQIEGLRGVEHELRKQLQALQESLAQEKQNVARLISELDAERKQGAEKLALIVAAREDLSNQFKALAADILDEKTKKFTEQNETNLNTLLGPLKERLTAFQAKVEEVYVNEAQGRSALVEQVKMLTALNTSLREETQNLTLALTGDSKAQGDYGELLLDDVLERAGLKEGQHYARQDSVKSEDGVTHLIPDVVIHLPGDRHLVVDSKMSLPDYKVFSSTRDEMEKKVALKRHLDSVRRHIKGLSAKNYQTLYGLRSLDFVVMFIPLEPAFMVAVTNDHELFHDAWEQNILLVSPSTLLFVVRTVHNLWRQEEVSRNAKAISARGAELYDKFVGFVEVLEDLGKRLQQAQNTYFEARKKLSEGSGNLVRQAEMLRDLGLKPSKRIAEQWTKSSGGEADAGLLPPAATDKAA